MEDLDINDQELIQERSNLMDRKIIEKERTELEKNLKLEKKKEDEETKKRLAKGKKLEQGKLLNKKHKQKLKDVKRRKNRKSKSVENVPHNDDVQVVHNNIRPVPENCKHLVSIDDVLYVVPGDGCCGSNCAAAFLFHDEVYGPRLRKTMNIFIAEHWYDRYQYISQCSPGHPFVRKLGSISKQYTEPEKLIAFLRLDEAAYMWTDSEDLSFIADMYQVKIRVITTKGKDDKNPTVNWITPDVGLRKFAQLKGGELGVMTLLQEDNIHLILVIDKKSDLAILGSLSYRFNVGPTNKTNNKAASEEKSNNKESLEKEPETVENLKKEFKRCKYEKKAIKDQY